MEAEELDLQTVLDEPCQYMDLVDELPEMPPRLERQQGCFGTDIDFFAEMRKQLKRKRTDCIDPDAKEESFGLPEMEEHFCTLQDGMIICPKCGEDIRLAADGDSEDEYSEDEDWVSSDEDFTDVE